MGFLGRLRTEASEQDVDTAHVILEKLGDRAIDCLLYTSDAADE